MSFLRELREKKYKLKETETIVTQPDGQRFVENAILGTVEKLASHYGFVVDTKPDNVPAKVIDHLYIGSQDCTVSDVLRAYNIESVLSIGVNIDVDVDHKYVECLDLPETDVKPVLADSLPFIHAAVEAGKNILVHCNAGVSRTSMVVIAYLMKYKNMTFNDAYSLVKEKRPAIQPNAGFRNQLNALH